MRVPRRRAPLSARSQAHPNRRRTRQRLAVAGLIVGPLLLGASSAQAAVPCGTYGVLSINGVTASCTYAHANNVGLVDSFGVLPSVNHVDLVVIGGKGGGTCANANAGGYGDRVSATYIVDPGAILSVSVAGNGGTVTCSGGSNAGGFGGIGNINASGGNGGTRIGGPSKNNGAGGGGASTVAVGISLMAMAGGGGGAGGAPLILGGNARQAGLGCPDPYTGSTTSCSSGGQPGTTSANGSGANPGDGFTGGAGGSNNLGTGTAGGGGGGGFRGGGGGYASSTAGAGGGGGGSSYLGNGSGGNITTASTSTPSVTITWTLPTVTLALGAIRNAGTGATWAGSEDHRRAGPDRRNTGRNPCKQRHRHRHLPALRLR